MEIPILRAFKALKECCSVCGELLCFPSWVWLSQSSWACEGEAGLWQTLECTKETWGVSFRGTAFEQRP